MLYAQRPKNGKCQKYYVEPFLKKIKFTRNPTLRHVLNIAFVARVLINSLHV